MENQLNRDLYHIFAGLAGWAIWTTVNGRILKASVNGGRIDQLKAMSWYCFA